MVAAFMIPPSEVRTEIISHFCILVQGWVGGRSMVKSSPSVCCAGGFAQLTCAINWIIV